MPQGFSFYTDGSADRSENIAGAAVVLIVATAHGPRWGGWVTSLCIGAATAPRAEATALLLALRWLRQLLHSPQYERPWVEFVFDCLSIARVANGEHGASANTDIGVVVKSMIHWLQPACKEPFHWTFQPSHTGHPWNEAADTLCRRTVRTQKAIADMQTYNGYGCWNARYTIILMPQLFTMALGVSTLLPR